MCLRVCIPVILRRWEVSFLLISLFFCLPTETICYHYFQQAHSGADGVTYWVSVSVYLYVQHVRVRIKQWIKVLCGVIFYSGLEDGNVLEHFQMDFWPLIKTALSRCVCACIHHSPRRYFLTSRRRLCSIGGQACEVLSCYVLTHPVQLWLRQNLPNETGKNCHGMKNSSKTNRHALLSVQLMVDVVDFRAKDFKVGGWPLHGGNTQFQGMIGGKGLREGAML